MDIRAEDKNARWADSGGLETASVLYQVLWSKATTAQEFDYLSISVA